MSEIGTKDSHQIQIPIKKKGKAHAILLWWTMQLDEDGKYVLGALLLLVESNILFIFPVLIYKRPHRSALFGEITGNNVYIIYPMKQQQ
jgi:hypothetical protein